MHLVLLEKAFPIMCLDLSFIIGENPSKLTLALYFFFSENGSFLEIFLRTHKLSFGLSNFKTKTYIQ